LAVNVTWGALCFGQPENSAVVDVGAEVRGVAATAVMSACLDSTQSPGRPLGVPYTVRSGGSQVNHSCACDGKPILVKKVDV